MKNKILTFIIGVLTGAIIMALVFLVFTKPSQNINNGNFRPNENGQMQRPDGNMGEPPEKPYDNRPMPNQ